MNWLTAYTLAVPGGNPWFAIGPVTEDDRVVGVTASIGRHALAIHRPLARVRATVDIYRCRVCGKTGQLALCDDGTALTPEQWAKHAGALYDESREYGANKTNAWDYAESEMRQRYGPRPDEAAQP